MKTYLSILVAVAVIVSAQAKAAHHKASIEPKYDFEGFDCTGLEWGDYPHPTECTKYVTCAPDGTHERDCAACDPAEGPDRCPHGRTQWSTPQKACLWAFESDCGGEQPTEQPTEAPTTTTTTPEPECDPGQCEQDGYCDWYKICVDGKWVRHQCSNGAADDWQGKLWWNPNAEAPVNQNGVCDFWDNLHADTQDTYQLDEECHTKEIDCYWRSDDQCDNKYWYLAAGQNHHSKEESFSCPQGLFWNQDKTNCAHCSSENCVAC